MHKYSLRFRLMIVGVCVLLFVPIIFAVIGQFVLEPFVFEEKTRGNATADEQK